MQSHDSIASTVEVHDRRRAQRARVCIWCTELRGRERFERRCMDLSVDGAFLAYALPPAGGGPMRLRLDLMDGGPPLSLAAEPVGFQSKYCLFGFGVRFLAPDEEARGRLAEFVARAARGPVAVARDRG